MYNFHIRRRARPTATIPIITPTQWKIWERGLDDLFEKTKTDQTFSAYLKSNVLAQFFSIYQKIITDRNMQWKFFTGLALVMAIKYAVGQEAESGNLLIAWINL